MVVLEVVLAEHGEPGGVEGHGVHPGEVERVAADLHGERVGTGGDHAGQQLLQVGRLGRGDGGARRLEGAAVDAEADGADRGDPPAEGGERRLEQEDGGGLAVRAGDGERIELVGRVAVDGCGQRRHGGPWVGDHRDRQP